MLDGATYSQESNLGSSLGAYVRPVGPADDGSGANRAAGLGVSIEPVGMQPTERSLSREPLGASRLQHVLGKLGSFSRAGRGAVAKENAVSPAVEELPQSLHGSTAEYECRLHLRR